MYIIQHHLHVRNDIIIVFHKFSIVVYVVNRKRIIFYKPNNLLPHIPNVTDFLSSGSLDHPGLCVFRIDMARYVWYRLFFSILFNSQHTENSKKELLTYLTHNPEGYKNR